MTCINYVMKTAYTGGDFVNRCHVTALNQQGIHVQIIQLPERARRPRHRWLSPITSRQNTNDIFVLSEGDRDIQAELVGHRRIVQHNQAPYYTFAHWKDATELNDSPIEALIVPSWHSLNILQTAGVRKPIHVVRPFVDPIFHGQGPKKRVIAYNPNKRPVESRFIQGYLRSRYPQLSNIPWVPLVGMSRQEVARVLSESLVYASFAELESLGLLSLEAMQSGCLVIGYRGQGGQEYATDANGIWVQDGDVHAFVDQLATMLLHTTEPQLDAMRAKGHQTAQAFSEQRFNDDLSQAWTAILGDRADQFAAPSRQA